jgi:hypothetical protein
MRFQISYTCRNDTASMTSSEDFDSFLKTGYLNALRPGSSMNILLQKYGDDYWSVKERETNGLIYGIITVGGIEFHIHNEIISAINYRPDHFKNSEYQGKEGLGTKVPWIFENPALPEVEANLSSRQISYTKRIIHGPKNEPIKFAAGDFHLHLEANDKLVILETEGGVTILFDQYGSSGPHPKATQICKYYF